MPTPHFGFSDVDSSAPLAYNPLVQLQTFKAEVDDVLFVMSPSGVSIPDPGANGIVVRTGAGTTEARTLIEPVSGFSILDPDGVAGDPTFALTDDLAALESLSGTGIAKRTGTSSWSVGSLVIGDIPDLSAIYQPLDGDLSAIAALAGTAGLARKTAANTWALDTAAYATQAYADALVLGLLDDRGNFDASGNVFPSSGGSGSAGAILKGDLWTISVAGTLGGHPVTAGDVVRSLADTPGQTDANWAIGENNFGYVALNQALADGKIYVGNGSGIGTAVTPTGDVTITNAGVTAIGALKVTNAMLAGSIAASKLVGTDIATVGTLTAGATGAGFTVALSTSTITGTLADARLSANVAFRNAANAFAGHQTPSLPDTYDLGSFTNPWRSGHISEMNSTLFAQNTISVIGGWLIVTKDEGTVDEDVDTSETQIDFGANAIVANDFIVFRSAGAVEYMQATSLVSGNTWNVTRNVDGSGANAWPQGSVWVNFGYNGTGRIELNANATPRLSMMRQGTSYNTQTEIVRIGDLNGWSADYTVETYGVAIGSPVDSWIKIDPTNGVRLGFDAGNLTLDDNGITIETGLSDINKITWKSGGAAEAAVFANNHVANIQGLGSATNQLSAVQLNPLNSDSNGPLFQLAVGGSTHAISPNQSYATLGAFSSVAFHGLAIYNDSTIGIVPTSLLYLNLRDAATNAFTDIVTLGHYSTGTPAANFGSSFLFKLNSATVNNRDAGRLGVLWSTATDASRTSAFVIQTVNNAGALAEVARFSNSGINLLEGAAINFDNGDLTITQSGDTLTFAGGGVQIPNLGLGLAADATAKLTTGNIRVYESTPPNADASTNRGIIINSTIPSGIITESATTDGEVVSYAANTTQVGTRDTARVGGLLRIDTRPAEQRLVVYGYATGGSVAADRFSVNLQVGNVKIAGNAARGTTEGTNHLDIFNGTAPVGTLTNGISIYSSAGECYIIDAGGTATLQSPHASDAPAWMYDDDSLPPNISRETNAFAGTIRFVNHTRQARLQQMLIDGEAMPASPEKRKIIHEETYAQYNTRMKLNPGDERYLALADWDKDQESHYERAEQARDEWSRKSSDEKAKNSQPEEYVKRPRPAWLKK